MKLRVLMLAAATVSVASLAVVGVAQSVQEGHNKSRQITKDPVYLTKRAEVRRLAQEGHQAVVRQDYREAEKFLRSCLKIDPYYYPASVDLGRALEGQGKVKEAIEAYRSVLRPTPGVSVSSLQHDSPLLTRYAVLCARVNQWHESRIAVNEAIANSAMSEILTPIPNGVKPQLTQLQALSLLFDGVQATKNGDDEANRKAIDLFNAALDLSPNLAAASYQKGLALENLGRHSDAENAYRGAALNGNNTLKLLVKEKAPDAHLQ